jgi:hypothetical protein
VKQLEIEHRNQILRTYLEGRNWDGNGEYALKRQLVLMSAQLLPDYPYVIEDEWEVELGRTDRGRGDLVFTDGTGCFAVVEVKWLDLESTGRTGTTKRTSNRKKRRAVEEQALTYANYYTELALSAFETVRRIEAFVFTNEYQQPYRLQTKNF